MALFINAKQYIPSIYVLAIAIIYYIALYTRTSTYFVGEVESYYYLIGICFLSAGYFIRIIFRKADQSIELKKCDIFIVFGAIIPLLKTINPFSFSQKFIFLISVSAIYFIIRTTILLKKDIIFLILIISTTYFLELAVLYDLNSVNFQSILLPDSFGTFTNSNLFAGYMVAILPLVIYVYNRNGNSGVRTLFLVLLFTSVIFILFITKSRASFFSLIISASVFGYFYYPKLSYLALKYVSYRLLILSILTIFIILFLYKIDSSIGRVLILEISGRHFFDSPVLGFGYGSFHLEYPQWQALYFSKGITFEKYKIVADVTISAFNEYLQILLETGMVGFVNFLVMIFLTMKINARENDFYLCTMLKTSIIAILIAGLFSYPLHNLVILLLFFICLGLITNLSQEKVIKIFVSAKILKLLSALCIGICIYLSAMFYKKMQALDIWTNIQQDARNGELKVLVKFDELYPTLKDNGLFLYNYGETLFIMGKYAEAVRILEESKKWIIKENTFYYLGEAYHNLKKHNHARENYVFISNMLPNRFKPQYLLVKLYQDVGDIKNATITAKKILKMPIKIHSEEVSKIREEMKYFLNQPKLTEN